MNKDNFEQALSELARRSDRIKSQDTNLAEAIKCYEEGMEYYKICSEILDNAKQTIELFEGEK